MKVYSLTGASGTGKSFSAMALANKKNLEAIIDDGLFIYDNKIEAGISAKKAETKVGAIKTALFTDDEHRKSVVEALRKRNPNSVLLLATSERMAERIAERLDLPEIYEKIKIEDISSDEDRAKARNQRYRQGKHVIPVATPELKRDFAGYFLDPMKIFRGKMGGKVSEKTVVRPTYSYMGNFSISDKVIMDIARCLAKRMDGVTGVRKVYENNSPEDMRMKVMLELAKNVKSIELASVYQRELLRIIEKMTAYSVTQIDIEIL